MANFVNAFDNTLILGANATLTDEVSKCYKTFEDYNDMYDFILEVVHSIDYRINSTSFLSKDAKKLHKSLKKVIKCKSESKSGKAMNKAFGFDVFADFHDKVEDHIKKFPTYHIGSPRSGTDFGNLVYSMIEKKNRN